VSHDLFRLILAAAVLAAALPFYLAHLSRFRRALDAVPTPRPPAPDAEPDPNTPPPPIGLFLWADALLRYAAETKTPLWRVALAELLWLVTVMAPFVWLVVELNRWSS